jgi:hypothetical protein
MSHAIYRIIHLLETNRVHFELSRHRPESLMITLTLVGERIEIDVFEDGHVQYSRFRGDESAEDDMPMLEALLREYVRQ